MADREGKTVCEERAMKFFSRAAAISLLVGAVILGAVAADQSKTFYNKGRDAEARQNY